MNEIKKSKNDNELEVLAGGATKTFVVGGRKFEIKEMTLRQAGRISTKLVAIFQEIEKDPVTANEKVIDFVLDNIFELEPSEKESFLDTCPASQAVEMVSAFIDANQRLLENFLALIERIKSKIPTIK